MIYSERVIRPQLCAEAVRSRAIGFAVWRTRMDVEALPRTECYCMNLEGY